MRVAPFLRGRPVSCLAAGSPYAAAVRYFEDFRAGQVFELGAVTFTTEAILDFGHQWDPQVFHVDEIAAKGSSYGGLIASGMHTLAVLMRLFVDGVLGDAASQGSPGLDEVRWLKPVRPGDILSGRITVEDAKPSATRPDRGTLRLLWEMLDPDAAVVMSLRSRNLIARRPS